MDERNPTGNKRRANNGVATSVYGLSTRSLDHHSYILLTYYLDTLEVRLTLNSERMIEKAHVALERACWSNRF
jgi:hypothetical protein